MQRHNPAAISYSFARFRESHHAVAREFAKGLTLSEVCRSTGYTRRRLKILLDDPTFQELITSYAVEFGNAVRQDFDAYDDLQRKNMLLAEQQITDRLDGALDEDGDPIPLHILDRISQSRADRTGYSKHSTVKHEHSFADALDKAIERSNKARVIDHVPAQIEARPLPDATHQPPDVPTKGAEPLLPKPSFKRVLTKK